MDSKYRTAGIDHNLETRIASNASAFIIKMVLRNTQDLGRAITALHVALIAEV